MPNMKKRISSKSRSRSISTNSLPEVPFRPSEGQIGFSTGAVRSADVAGDGSPRFELVCPTALRRLALTMAEGAAKYGEHNWTKGIPNSNSINHAMAHLQEYLSGDRSEDHLGHALANIQFIIHFNNGCQCAAGFELLEATNA